MTTGNIIYQVTQEDLLAVVTKAVQDVLENAKPKHEEPRYYTRDEVCSILKISRPTFHSLVNKGEIAVIKVGKRTLIDANHLDAMVASGMIQKYRRS